jgi:hypothetical protein
MKEIWKTAGKVLFFAFVVMLLGWAANLTVLAVQAALPDDLIAPYLALALFDIGAFAWLTVFMNIARGNSQRTTAFMMTIFDLVGVVFMAAGGLGALSPATVTLGLVIATGLNYVGWYIFKVTDIEVIEAIQEQSLEDEQFNETLKRKKELFHTAMRQTKAMLDRDGYKLAAIISKRNYIAIKNQMNLELTAAEARAWDKDAIDAETEDIELPALSGDNQPGIGRMFGAWLKSFFARQNGYSTNNDSILSQSPPSLNEEDKQD